MTDYLKKSFSVKTGGRSPQNCEHGWRDRRGLCVMCGEDRLPKWVRHATVSTIPDSAFTIEKLGAELYRQAPDIWPEFAPKK